MMNKPLLAAAPVIETERLRLRPLDAPDLAAFCDLWNEPAVYHYITKKPLSVEEHWGRIMRLVGQWPLVGYGSWAVTEKASDKFIGQCGFMFLHREMDHPMPEPEIGWALSGRCHGKGLGFEATSAALTWFDQQFDIKQTACIIDPTNAPSQKLAAKLGYKLAAKTTYKEDPVWLFHRQRGITSPQ